MRLALTNDTIRLLNNLKDYCQTRFEIAAGNELLLNSSEQSCIIKATTKETFDSEIRIPHLPGFVRILQSFATCELELFNQYMNIYNSYGHVKYAYAPKVVGGQAKVANLSDATCVASFTLDSDVWKMAQRFSSYPDMHELIFDFTQNQPSVLLGSSEKTSTDTFAYQSSNTFKLNIDVQFDKDLLGKRFFIAVSRLKVLDCINPYTVSILFRRTKSKYVLKFNNTYTDNCCVEYVYSFEELL